MRSGAGVGPLGVFLGSSHNLLGVFGRLSVVCQLHLRLVTCEADFTLEDLRLAGRLVCGRILGFRSQNWVRRIASILTTLAWLNWGVLLLQLVGIGSLLLTGRIWSLLLIDSSIGWPRLLARCRILGRGQRGSWGSLLAGSRGGLVVALNVVEVVPGGHYMLGELEIIGKELAADLTGALLSVPCVLLMLVERNLAPSELFATLITVCRLLNLVLLQARILILLIDWSLKGGLQRNLALRPECLRLEILLLGASLSLLVLRLGLVGDDERPETQVELGWVDITGFRVHPLDVHDQARLRREALLTGCALVNRGHLLLMLLLVHSGLLSFDSAPWHLLQLRGTSLILHVAVILQHLLLASGVNLGVVAGPLVLSRGAPWSLIARRCLLKRCPIVVMELHLTRGPSWRHFLLARLLHHLLRGGHLPILGSHVLIKVVRATTSTPILLNLLWLLLLAALASLYRCRG